MRRDMLIKWKGSNPLLIAFWFLQRCAIPQYHQQVNKKDEEA